MSELASALCSLIAFSCDELFRLNPWSQEKNARKRRMWLLICSKYQIRNTSKITNIHREKEYVYSL